PRRRKQRQKDKAPVFPPHEGAAENGVREPCRRGDWSRCCIARERPGRPGHEWRPHTTGAQTRRARQIDVRISRAAGRAWVWARISSQNLECGYGHDESPPPAADVLQLLDNFIPQVPWQDQQIIGPHLLDPFRSQDWNPGAGEQLPLLVRVAINGKWEQVGAHSAIIQQGIALGGSAVGGHDLAGLGTVNEEVQQLAFGALSLRGKVAVGSKALQAGVLFRKQQGIDTGLTGAATCSVAGEDAERTAVGGQFLHVGDAQLLSFQGSAGGLQAEVAEMLVVNRIELIVAEELEQMREFEAE